MKIDWSAVVEYFFGFLAISFLIAACTGDMEDTIRENQHYCDMVKLQKDHNGDRRWGWPDYKGTYDEYCG